jgi:hypothetical protein
MLMGTGTPAAGGGPGAGSCTGIGMGGHGMPAPPGRLLGTGPPPVRPAAAPGMGISMGLMLPGLASCCCM